SRDRLGRSSSGPLRGRGPLDVTEYAVPIHLGRIRQRGNRPHRGRRRNVASVESDVSRSHQDPHPPTDLVFRAERAAAPPSTSSAERPGCCTPPTIATLTASSSPPHDAATPGRATTSASTGQGHRPNYPTGYGN